MNVHNAVTVISDSLLFLVQMHQMLKIHLHVLFYLQFSRFCNLWASFHAVSH